MRIYAVEISGECNMACPWCAMPNVDRPRGLMTEETVARAVKAVEYFGAHEPLFLHAFGEPALHPQFAEFAKKFQRAAVLSVSTNAVAVTEEWIDAIADIEWAWISISPWDTEAAERVGDMLRLVGIPAMVPIGIEHDWAGQAKLPAEFKHGTCEFAHGEMCVIRWDGSIAPCCISDRAEDSIGNIHDDFASIKWRKPEDLCKACHHDYI